MERIYASLIFFTRLPVWKAVTPPQSAYNDVVVLWPYIGWVTGGLTALAMWGLSYIMPWPVAVVLSIIVRLLITGALHEDGLADFCDGFGCGGDKTRILAIMKDSHIGTYGVIGLILYFLILVSVLTTLITPSPHSPLYPLTVPQAVAGFFAADAFAKFCAAQITNCLPYARPEGAKNKITYNRMTAGKWLVCFIGGAIPVAVSVPVIGLKALLACLLPLLTLLWLIHLMRKKIGGYTGDCCGAVFILCEVSFLTALSIVSYTLG